MRAAYAEALRRRETGELVCTDIVPAARTLLLDGLDDPAAVTSAWTTGRPSRPTTTEGELVELAVSYDGPDLESVAEHCGLEVEEVVRRHRAAEYVVAFCGFAPGFAYLTGLPAELEVPRLEEPRSKVPAGSVGLAGDLHRGLPTLLTRRLAADRAHRRAAVGRRPRAAGAAGARARRVRFTDG